jgi:DNA-directed RNA polymerase subunit B'
MATEVFLNGKYVGDVDSKDDFLKLIRVERRRGQVTQNLNIRYDSALDAITVETGRGRLRRPLIVVRDGQPLFTEKHARQLERNELSWGDLVQQGVIEYLDAEEEEDSLVAMTPQDLTPEHTHLEITPLAMFGYVTSLVSFGNHSAPTRISIGSKNQKQAIGFYAANFPVRMDMDVNLLHYPQVPLVQTAMHEVGRYARHPSGQNIVVAVMCYKGYNMEDSSIINKGSIERGMGRSTYFRPAVAEELRYSGGLMDQISIPDKDIKGYRSEKDYRLLEEDGIVFPEAVVKEDDVIIGKTSPPRFLSSLDEYSLAPNVRRESSIAMKHGENGIIDFIAVTENEEGNKLLQVRIRSPRVPEIGDKFISRDGQKGVVGLIVPEADMPFSASGVTPDLIFSPHSIPSRMTVSYLLELVSGKMGALSGRTVDGTPFDAEPEEAIRKELLSHGFHEDGIETFYNGITGEKFMAKIFVGDMYYLRLKHQVANKLQARARGPIQLLTRQPTEGRAKEGGLRLGEMEKDTLVAHGAAMVLKERFDSDRTVVPVCESCGSVAIYDAVRERRSCPICGENVEVNDIEVSYAFKLIMDEFKSLGIFPRLVLKNKY